MKDQTLSALLSDLGALSRDEIAGVLLALVSRLGSHVNATDGSPS